MQKDYMAMAQGQGVEPQQPPMPGQEQSPEEVQAKILDFFQDMNMLPPEGPEKQKIEEQALELAQLIIEGDEDKIAENPLYKVYVEAMANFSAEMTNQGMEPEQAQAQQQGPKDFASMMPPEGGGMVGR